MQPLTELQQRIGRSFKDAVLLERAVTHRSFANENRLSEHNERMEYLGDAVLGLVVSELLMEALPHADEGELSRVRAQVVSEPSLAAVSRRIGLGPYLRLGRGEEQTGGRDKDSLLADGLEAVVAALYQDGGIGAAREFIVRSFSDAIAQARSGEAITDHKTALQELCQERLKTLPEYRVVSESGPDHSKEFSVELSVKGEVLGRGTGRSKKEAEQRAAKEAMEYLRRLETEDRRQ